MIKNGPFMPVADLRKLCETVAYQALGSGSDYPDGRLESQLQTLNDGDFDRMEWFNYGIKFERDRAGVHGPVAPNYAVRKAQIEQRINLGVAALCLFGFGVLIGMAFVWVMLHG